MTWGGFRGAIPMVLVLTLPQQFPHRELLINMTFGVVILSILIQGLSISPLLKYLKIVTGTKDRGIYEYLRGQLQAAHAGLKELEQMSHLHFINREILENLKLDYRKRIDNNLDELRKLDIKKEEVEAEEHEWALRHLLLTEKININRAYHHGAINQEAREWLLTEIDTKLIKLDSKENDQD